jgi:hypothetical protein
MPPAARHSIATSHVPLLPSVPSASQLPHLPGRASQTAPNVDLHAAIEYHKSTAQHLRQIHDNDRKAWEIEKSALLARIADLEFKLNKARDPNRRSSNESSFDSARSFRSDLRSSNTSHSNGTSRKPSENTFPGSAPVWQGPENTPPVTRVFSHDDDVSHLPSISEDGPMPTLSKQVSPSHKEEAHTIPIEQIDKELDGINVKSTGPAVTSSFEKVSSPSIIGSPNREPSPETKDDVSDGLRVNMGRLLSPLDEKLKRHAGHTPMAFDGAISTEDTTDTFPTPKTEKPPAPAPSARPPVRPSENMDSYFSFSGESRSVPHVKVADIPEEAVDEEAQLETDEDPSLKGPLMLDPSAKSEAANVFLEQVDAKLMEAASHHRSDSSLHDEEDKPPNGMHARQSKKDDEPFPELKIRKSTNFGSAWGEAPLRQHA